MIVINNISSALNEIGNRKNNEDNISPAKSKAAANEKLFLVCDGVGGSNKGEVASELVCNLLPQYFTNSQEEEVNKTFVNKGLKEIEKKFTEMTDEYPEHTGMATTLTMLYFDDKGAIVGWCGDSRVYHIRDGEILYVTEDHSKVNELLKQGKITKKEAKNHREKNKITRAIQGSENPTRIDIKHILDIKIGDYFILCTDGILESVDDSTLEMLCVSKNSPNQITEEIQNLCSRQSKDNYSMYVVQVSEVRTGGHEVGRNEVKPNTLNVWSSNLKLIIAFIAGAVVSVALVLSGIFNEIAPKAKGVEPKKQTINARLTEYTDSLYNTAIIYKDNNKERFGEIMLRNLITKIDTVRHILEYEKDSIKNRMKEGINNHEALFLINSGISRIDLENVDTISAITNSEPDITTRNE